MEIARGEMGEMEEMEAGRGKRYKWTNHNPRIPSRSLPSSILLDRLLEPTEYFDANPSSTKSDYDEYLAEQMLACENLLDNQEGSPMSKADKRALKQRMAQIGRYRNNEDTFAAAAAKRKKAADRRDRAERGALYQTFSTHTKLGHKHLAIATRLLARELESDDSDDPSHNNKRKKRKTASGEGESHQSSSLAPRGPLSAPPNAPAGLSTPQPQPTTQVDVVSQSEDSSDSEASEAGTVIQQFHRTGARLSLPYYNILLAGVPENIENYAPIFRNRLIFESPESLYECSLAATCEHLRALAPRGQRELLTLVNERHARQGSVGVIMAACEQDLLPANAGAQAEVHEYIGLLAALEHLPFGDLLVQGSERTDDIWVWQPFYKLLMIDNVCVHYGEIQADATMLARRNHTAYAEVRSEDWLVVVADEGGPRGQGLGVGDSLGDLDFTSDEAVQKIIKSARSARDMALRNRNMPIVWLLHSHRDVLLFVVWARTTNDSVIAEFIGHCRNPVAVKNVALGVANCADLLMKARQIIRNALRQVQNHKLAPRGLDKRPEKELPILATPKSVRPAPRFPAVGLVRIAPDAEASKRRRSFSVTPQSPSTPPSRPRPIETTPTMKNDKSFCLVM
ncbi:hypothetical protein HDU87_002613 [Geranomyces variabilis]|uniref:Uncharacterized protein n=1 Tax=Geranomyces variabilis TaxID=109894 RepID=A0AAD5XVU1_9FUNG|nr:hypothetical protein HDU87_002613 [Geranomyces variabilis]